MVSSEAVDLSKKSDADIRRYKKQNWRRFIGKGALRSAVSGAIVSAPLMSNLNGSLPDWLLRNPITNSIVENIPQLLQRPEVIAVGTAAVCLSAIVITAVKYAPNISKARKLQKQRSSDSEQYKGFLYDVERLRSKNPSLDKDTAEQEILAKLDEKQRENMGGVIERHNRREEYNRQEWERGRDVREKRDTQERIKSTKEHHRQKKKEGRRRGRLADYNENHPDTQGPEAGNNTDNTPRVSRPVVLPPQYRRQQQPLYFNSPQQGYNHLYTGQQSYGNPYVNVIQQSFPQTTQFQHYHPLPQYNSQWQGFGQYTGQQGYDPYVNALQQSFPSQSSFRGNQPFVQPAQANITANTYDATIRDELLAYIMSNRD